MSSDRIDALSRSLADSTSRRSLLRLPGIGVAGTAVEGIEFRDARAKTFSKLDDIPFSGLVGETVKSFRASPVRRRESLRARFAAAMDSGEGTCPMSRLAQRFSGS